MNFRWPQLFKMKKSNEANEAQKYIHNNKNDDFIEGRYFKCRVCGKEAHYGIKFLCWESVFVLNEGNHYEELAYCLPHYVQILRETADDFEKWDKENKEKLSL